MGKQKYAIVILIFSILLTVSGCMDRQNKELKVNRDPEPIDITASVPLNFDMETDYSNISVKTELSIYSKSTEKIIYTIINSNAGKGFYYYSVPYIEYYEKGKWIRLAYYPPDYSQETERWSICGIEGNDKIPYSCNGVFYPQSVSNGVKDGLFRLVVFVGNNKVNAEFEFKD